MVVCIAGGFVLSPVVAGIVERVPEPTELSTRWRASLTVVLVACFAAAALRWGPSLDLVPHLFLVAVLVAVSAIDLATLRIPDRIVFPAIAASAAMLVILAPWHGGAERIAAALVGSVLYFVTLLLPHVLYPRGMGFGDVKLALLLGLFLGWGAETVFDAVLFVLTSMVLGTIIGTIHGVALLVRDRRNVGFPFGPSLAVSTYVALLASDWLV